jgi:hypothetical protein
MQLTIVEAGYATQMLPITTASVQSAPFGFGTTSVTVSADSPCSISRGRDPAAWIADGVHMAAGGTQVLDVLPGWKIAVIAAPA